MEDPAACRDALWRVLLAEPCFLRAWEFDGGLRGDLVRFELVWLWLKLEAKLVAKLMAGSAPRDVDSWLDKMGLTPLSWAAANGHETVVNLLLGTGKVDVDTKDKFGMTPLSWAAWSGHEAVVKLLLGTGKADVDAKSNPGWTPLSWAAWSEHEAVVELLKSVK